MVDWRVQEQHELVPWLLESDEPWTRYRALLDLLGLPMDHPLVQTARCEMLAHPMVQRLIAEVVGWPSRAIKRHNDASHPIHKLSTLADFGLRALDGDGSPIVEAVLVNQAPEGAFQSLVNIPRVFGGTDEDKLTWVLCDTPVLLYSMLAMGVGEDARVKRAINHLVGLSESNGWRCVAAPDLGRFRGPGSKADPCPMACLYALKALAQLPELQESPAVHAAAETLLAHWDHRTKSKLYMFGVGSEFRKLKYPFVWYDILHVVDVLSRFPSVHTDPRFQQMVTTIVAQADEQGRYTAGSIYQAWKGWSFADKRNASPWLTLLVLRVLGRTEQLPVRSH